jgi:hypothetical protein
MKKEIIIYECDVCGVDLIERHDTIYYLIKTVIPGIFLQNLDEPETILCERCFNKAFPRLITKIK